MLEKIKEYKKLLLLALVFLFITLMIAIFVAQSFDSDEYRIGLDYIYNSSEIENELKYVGKVSYFRSSKFESIRNDNYCRLYYSVDSKGTNIIIELELTRDLARNDSTWEVTNYKIVSNAPR